MKPNSSAIAARQFTVSRILAILIALAILHPFLGVAGNQVPLKLVGAGSFCQPEDCPEIVETFDFETFPLVEATEENPILNVAYGFDQGIGSHFGAYSVLYRIDFLTNLDAEGHFILTTADGSGFVGRNFFTFTGFNADGVGVWDVGVEFLHGFGRFEGLTGSTFGQALSPDFVDFNYQVEGTLNNPGRGRGRRR